MPALCVCRFSVPRRGTRRDRIPTSISRSASAGVFPLAASITSGVSNSWNDDFGRCASQRAVPKRDRPGSRPCLLTKPPRRLQDIVDNARAIFSYTEGIDLTAFEEDRRTYDAVECCMERISFAFRQASLADASCKRLSAISSKVKVTFRRHTTGPPERAAAGKIAYPTNPKSR
jgi:hypothetical protein